MLTKKIVYLLFFITLALSQSCNTIRGLSQQQKDSILKLHNDLRQQVASGKQGGQYPAANMQLMNWSDELEQSAQRWANNCRINNSSNQDIGENISYETSSKEYDHQGAVNGWFKQVSSFSPYSTEQFQSGNYLNFSQMTWADSSQIGCGLSKYKDQYTQGDQYTYLLVCHYKNRGNWINEKMYSIGQGCSQCPPQTTCDSKYSSLCSKSNNSSKPQQGNPPKNDNNNNGSQSPYQNKYGCLIVTSGLSQQEKDIMLQTHNQLRQKVASGQQQGQPKAANMNELVWDEGLASQAQDWADRCQETELNMSDSEIGQNMSYNTDERYNAEEIVNGWFNQVQNFPAGAVDSFYGGSYLGYSQLIWAESYQVGCGKSQYKKGQYKYQLTVCYFKERGNWKNSKVYERTNKSCSNCPNGCSRQYPALCINQNNGNQPNQPVNPPQPNPPQPNPPQPNPPQPNPPRPIPQPNPPQPNPNDRPAQPTNARCSNGYKMISSGISQQEKQIFLDYHNELRQKVASGQQSGQPQAANMQVFQWDDSLAASAQEWANTCNYQHSGKPGLGENLAYQTGQAWNPKDPMNDWYNEVTEIPFPTSAIDRFYSAGGYLHYTTMLWAETTKVGCGKSYYFDGQWDKQYTVCHYKVQGNMLEQKMYIRGRPCSQCPKGISCSGKYNSLCG